MTSSTVPSVQSDTAQHDEALACSLPPAGPLRGAVFEGMNDTTLDDETWLARAVAAAAAQGLVRDPEDVSLRLGAVDLVDAAAETTDADAMSVSDDTATVTGHGQGNPSSVGKYPVTKKNYREEPVPRPVKGWTCWSGNKTLLVDNYDSYTFNLFHLICAVEGGVPPVVIRNDDYTWSDLELSFKTRHFTRVVLSPGPGNPAVDKDVGVMNDILKNATNTPILGVCLGHQALALVHGVDVVRAHVPTHGRVSVMTHDGGGGGLFNGIPERFTQTRYHSLTVCPASLKKSDRLIATAWTASTNDELTTGKYGNVSTDASPTGTDAGVSFDGLTPNQWVSEEDIANERGGGAVMAIKHKTRPHVGVQFHPESICSTPHGETMYANFVKLANDWWAGFDLKNPARVVGVDAAPVAAVLVPLGVDPAESGTGTRKSESSHDEIHRKNSSRIQEKDAPKPTDDSGPTKLLWMKLPGVLKNTPGGAETIFWRTVVNQEALRLVMTGGGNNETTEDELLTGTSETDAGGTCETDFACKTKKKNGWKYAATEASRDTFWLDSATASAASVDSGGKCSRSRFSFMGGVGGGLWRRVLFDVTDEEGGVLRVTTRDGDTRVSENVQITKWLDETLRKRKCGSYSRVRSWAENASRRAEEEQVLAGEVLIQSETRGCESPREPNEPPPFDFHGGFVGYLGYEIRGECGSGLDWSTRKKAGVFDPSLTSTNSNPGSPSAPTPDAAFFVTDRLVVCDHTTGDVFIAALAPDVAAELGSFVSNLTSNENRNGLSAAAGEAAKGVLRVAINDAEHESRVWLAQTERAVLGCASGDVSEGVTDVVTKGNTPDGVTSTQPSCSAGAPVGFTQAMRRASRLASEETQTASTDLSGQWRDAGFVPRRDRDAYVADIIKSQNAIAKGETYEVCLTNQLHRKGTTAGDSDSSSPKSTNLGDYSDCLPIRKGAPDPATLYAVLRQTNPAPYGAFLNFGGCGVDGGSRKGVTKALRIEETCVAKALRTTETSTDTPGARVFLFDDGSFSRETGFSFANDVVAICCSSPERFLRLTEDRGDSGTGSEVKQKDSTDGSTAATAGQTTENVDQANTHTTNQAHVETSKPTFTLEAKPIKGTAPRRFPLGGAADKKSASDLANRVKDRAENLMIVDLLRNDLSRVCVPGSVTVPGLMKIETYATVHQLVSTVRGTKKADVSSVKSAIAAFPPGSMTGAPKIRTCEIIDGLETGPRGVYSGCLGYFSQTGNTFDLNVVIRTCVVRPGTDECWIGCGGAITGLSDAREEWDEICLKAKAVVAAVRAVDESYQAA